MNPESFKNFEHKVDRLVELLDRLQSENRVLRERESNLLRERSKLLEKNELARAKVDSMINRLKSLNTESYLCHMIGVLLRLKVVLSLSIVIWLLGR